MKCYFKLLKFNVRNIELDWAMEMQRDYQINNIFKECT